MLVGFCSLGIELAILANETCLYGRKLPQPSPYALVRASGFHIVGEEMEPLRLYLKY